LITLHPAPNLRDGAQGHRLSAERTTASTIAPDEAVALIVLGLFLLAGGGEALVRASTTLAELAGVTPAGGRISRVEGGILVVAYAAYLASLFTA
jgi:hypothetical protein